MFEESYIVNLIPRKTLVHEFDIGNLEGPPLETSVLIGQIEKYFKKYFEITQRQIVWYAELGLISKSIRDGRSRIYKFRTFYDLYALWIIKNTHPISIINLSKKMKNSILGLYEVVFCLQNLKTKLIQNFGIPTVTDFINELNMHAKRGGASKLELIELISGYDILAMKNELDSITVLMTSIIPRVHKDLLDKYFQFIAQGKNPLYLDIEVIKEEEN